MARVILIGITAAVVALGVEARRRGGADAFLLDAEGGVPAVWSGFLLLLAAWAAVANGTRWPWLALAALFAFMAFDEVAGLHEWLERETRVDWQLLYLPLIGLGAAAALAALLRVRNRVAFAAAGAAWAVAQAFEALQWDGAQPAAGYGPLMIAEEVLEMAGSLGFALVLFASAASLVQDKSRIRPAPSRLERGTQSRGANRRDPAS